MQMPSTGIRRPRSTRGAASYRVRITWPTRPTTMRPPLPQATHSFRNTTGGPLTNARPRPISLPVLLRAVISQAADKADGSPATLPASNRRRPAEHMKPPHSKSFLGSVWRLRTLFGPAAGQVWRTGIRKQVVRIAARRSGRERRWKMRLVRAGRRGPAKGRERGTRSKSHCVVG